MRACVGEKVALTLETQAERRRDQRMAYHGHVMQRVVEAEREAHHQQRGADFNLVEPAEQVLRREGVVDRGCGQRYAVDLDHCYVYISCCINPLPPHPFATDVERDRKAGGTGHIVGIDMQLDLDPVRKVRAGFIDQDMPACHQEQAFITFEEKAAGIGQVLCRSESADACCG